MDNTVENLMRDRVFGIKTHREFLNYCAEPPREWSEFTVVTVEEFEKCLEDFKMARPGYAHYVH
jgi:hypothetical protein